MHFRARVARSSRRSPNGAAYRGAAGDGSVADGETEVDASTWAAGSLTSAPSQWSPTLKT